MTYEQILLVSLNSEEKEQESPKEVSHSPLISKQFIPIVLIFSKIELLLQIEHKYFYFYQNLPHLGITFLLLKYCVELHLDEKCFQYIV